jgi:hypothetical protein
VSGRQVKSSTEFDAAFATMEKKRPDALIVEGDIFFYSHRKRIVDFATKSHLPTVFTLRGFADASHELQSHAQLSCRILRLSYKSVMERIGGVPEYGHAKAWARVPSAAQAALPLGGGCERTTR